VPCRWWTPKDSARESWRRRSGESNRERRRFHVEEHGNQREKPRQRIRDNRSPWNSCASVPLAWEFARSIDGRSAFIEGTSRLNITSTIALLYRTRMVRAASWSLYLALEFDVLEINGAPLVCKMQSRMCRKVRAFLPDDAVLLNACLTLIYTWVYVRMCCKFMRGDLCVLQRSAIFPFHRSLTSLLAEDRRRGRCCYYRILARASNFLFDIHFDVVTSISRHLYARC